MTNEDWLHYFGLGWVLRKRNRTIPSEELAALKKMALECKPFAPSESFPDITEAMEKRAQKNQEFFRAATVLVPTMIDEIFRLRRDIDKS